MRHKVKQRLVKIIHQLKHWKMHLIISMVLLAVCVVSLRDQKHITHTAVLVSAREQLDLQANLAWLKASAKPKGDQQHQPEGALCQLGTCVLKSVQQLRHQHHSALHAPGSQKSIQSKHATNTRTVSRLPHPDWTLVAGELLNANLESAISTDLPGEVRAVLTSPAYAYVGHRILLPVGSRLLGVYAHHASQKQSRIWISWHRIITPQGVSITLDSSVVGLQGRSGLLANAVTQHFWQHFKQAALLSMIGGATMLAASSHSAMLNQDAGDVYRQQIADRFQNAATASMPALPDSSPTLKLFAGQSIIIFLRKDIDFYSLGGRA